MTRKLETVADTLDLFGEIAAAIGQRGGTLGMGALAAGALLRTAAKVMNETGDPIDALLSRIRAPRRLAMPWSPAPNGDAAVTVLEKRKPSKE